jgi:hypothetical protein
VNIVMLSLGNILGAFVTNQANYALTSPLSLFRLVCSFSAGFSLVVQCILWFSACLRERLRKVDRSIGAANYASSSRDEDVRLFFQATHVLSYIVVFVFLLYLTISRGSIRSYDDFSIFMWTIPYVFYVLSMSLFSMRLVKYKVIRGFVSIDLHSVHTIR